MNAGASGGRGGIGIPGHRDSQSIRHGPHILLTVSTRCQIIDIQSSRSSSTTANRAITAAPNDELDGCYLLFKPLTFFSLASQNRANTSPPMPKYERIINTSRKRATERRRTRRGWLSDVESSGDGDGGIRGVPSTLENVHTNF